MRGTHSFICRESRRQVSTTRKRPPLRRCRPPRISKLNCRHCSIRLIHARGIPGQLVDETILRRLYFIFYFIWLVARRRDEPHCHLAIDIDHLSLDDFYRREIENHLVDLVDMAIPFADCRVERYEETLIGGQFFEALEGEIEAFASQESLSAKVSRQMCKIWNWGP
jgi:hypothetical protein